MGRRAEECWQRVLFKTTREISPSNVLKFSDDDNNIMNTLEINQKKLKDLSYIFIVDDDEDDRELLTDALLESYLQQAQIKTAVDGVDLMEQLSATSVLPSFIILDLNMPKMCGREVLKAIRKNSELAHIPIIMFSTSDTDVDVKDCYSLGCNTYMTKPCDYLSLTTAVQIMLMYWTGNATLLTGI